MTSLQGHLWSHSGVQNGAQAVSLLPVKTMKFNFTMMAKHLGKKVVSVKTPKIGSRPHTKWARYGICQLEPITYDIRRAKALHVSRICQNHDWNFKCGHVLNISWVLAISRSMAGISRSMAGISRSLAAISRSLAAISRSRVFVIFNDLYCHHFLGLILEFSHHQCFSHR